jgi:hypothetical protein
LRNPSNTVVVKSGHTTLFSNPDRLKYHLFMKDKFGTFNLLKADRLNLLLGNMIDKTTKSKEMCATNQYGISPK